MYNQASQRGSPSDKVPSRVTAAPSQAHRVASGKCGLVRAGPRLTSQPSNTRIGTLTSNGPAHSQCRSCQPSHRAWAQINNEANGYNEMNNALTRAMIPPQAVRYSRRLFIRI